ncbi:MAG: alpha/beta hydrolase [Aeromicrobium erythreum]
MSSVSVPGAVLDVDVQGDDGPAVVVLHGLTSSRRRDALLGLDVAARVPGVRLLRYDARGHGRSTGRTVVDDYTWPRLADDLEHVIERFFPGEQVHGLGGSMGTATLLHAAVDDPSRFASLTLMIPPTAWASRRAKAAEYEASARLVETSGVDAFVALAADAVPPPATRGRPDTVPDVDEALLPTVLRGAAGSDLPSTAALATLDVPTQLLAWTDDPAHPLSTARTLHDLWPSSSLVVATTPDDVRGWSALLAEHVHRHDVAVRAGS